MDTLEGVLERLPPLPLSFYMREAPEVARDLLGKLLVVTGKDGAKAVEIVEVEAYLGASDPASHAYRGPTARNQAMFEGGGICYVYLSYGIHHCMNVVTGERNSGQAVLLRAGHPVFGARSMATRRGLLSGWGEREADGYLLRQLASGPGKLAQALGITLADYGRRFDEVGFRITANPKAEARPHIKSSPRIGISKATDLPLRFYVPDSPSVSKSAPSSKLPRRAR